ncbi:hypothetical protein HDU93_004805, partial [Gonapodya sp. JEL0774]
MSAAYQLYAAIVAAGLTPSTVIGFDPFNEPHHGMIGVPDIRELDPHQFNRVGSVPTSLQAMASGEGLPVEVDVWTRTQAGQSRTGTTIVDPKGTSAWTSTTLHGRKVDGCLWRDHGVWEPTSSAGAGAPRFEARLPHYFRDDPRTGRPADFVRDFLYPFIRAFGTGIRQLDSLSSILVQPPVRTPAALWDSRAFSDIARGYAAVTANGVHVPARRVAENVWIEASERNGAAKSAEATEVEPKTPDVSHGTIWAPHRYDGRTLMTKLWDISLSPKEMFVTGFGALKQEGLEKIGPHPIVIGEFGVPFDLNSGASFRTSYPYDYSDQTAALNHNMHGIEATLVDSTLWNYT